MSNPVGSYEHEHLGEEVKVELWRVEDFAEYVREKAPRGAACGCAILEPDIDYLLFEAEQHDDELSMVPLWAEGERNSLVMSKLLGVGVLDSRISELFWLKGVPEATPKALVEKLRGET